jgi:hypothetical protein
MEVNPVIMICGTCDNKICFCVRFQALKVTMSDTKTQYADFCHTATLLSQKQHDLALIPN